MLDFPLSSDRLFPGTSELAGLMRGLDWSATALGPPAGWPVSLRTMVGVVLGSPWPMIVLWGRELVQLYNDPYRDLMGAKHPAGLGQPTQECWPEVWDFNAPLYEGVQERGESFEFTDQPLVITRHGVEETAYFTLCFSPIYDQARVGGVLVAVQETTARVLAERSLSESTEQLQRRREEVEIRNQALEAFAHLTRELSFETDRLALIQRAQQIVLGLLPAGHALYYEMEHGRWRCRSQVGDLGDERLQAVVDGGLDYTAVDVLRPFTTLQAWYQDQHLPGGDTPADVIRPVGTAASIPVLVGGQPIGVFCVGLFEQRTWTSVDRAVLDTAMFSLTLALERASSVARIADERHKLEVANEDLEAFAYSVSHDLRTPIRHIQGFSQMLRKSLGSRLDDASGRYLQVMDESAGRMNSLIDAMLDLSRTSRQPLDLQPVDLEALAHTVRSELEPEMQGRQVEWFLGPLPLVSGDADLLRQVLLNLFSNALKYTRSRALTRIEVWADERPDSWVITVRDNGVGFDERYKSRLFGVFQRLHREDEFEGTGVGLANVRRIILRHGGRVSAESRLGEGASFCCTLPKVH
ncbi:sensor histidine kinase [Deinococcus koreensis]|uniref:histidine kinase n=1 Tax=Deinococcus koreensis TaxID=2054903 RepID=A0A2K3USD3_9DEIO|nr:ATP-binding protein [Deinococcus koreensis]PNY79434.1 histidine kinase [Deinococcus koreensis]